MRVKDKVRISKHFGSIEDKNHDTITELKFNLFNFLILTFT